MRAGRSCISGSRVGGEGEGSGGPARTRRFPVAKQLRCADIVPGCDYTAWAETEEELMELVVAHARSAHGIEEVTPEIAEKVRSAVEEV
ncbi:MAG: DUF1059 domain-containing protein [Gemmatimonadota bacterium]|nr:MAG: DUF1059 domain-containing protein [Gemmatimonadota bacterium]